MEEDRELLESVARTSLRTKLREEVADNVSPFIYPNKERGGGGGGGGSTRAIKKLRGTIRTAVESSGEGLSDQVQKLLGDPAFSVSLALATSAHALEAFQLGI